MERNKIASALFQVGLVLLIPGISYIYAQGVNGNSIESLGTAINDLHSTVKELTQTTNQLYNTTSLLTSETKYQQDQLNRLERDIQSNKSDIKELQRKGQ